MREDVNTEHECPNHASIPLRITFTGPDTKSRFQATFRQHELLEQALANINAELLTSENDKVMKRIEQRSSIAKKREPDVVIVPLSCFTEDIPAFT